MISSKVLDRIEEIKEFALKNENRVSLFTVQDIIKNKNEKVDEELINYVVDLLRKNGIMILPQDADEEYDTDGNEPENFIPAEVNITQVPMTVSNIMERLENEEYDLSPDFQRNGNLWTEEKQSRLIESLMLKIPLPAFYFDASREDQWVVIDGLQRLSAFRNYLVGGKNGQKHAFKGLQYLRDFNDKTFDELPRQYSRRIKEASIVAYTVQKGTPETIVFNIFQRINTGGEPLNSQEIRQALYSGKGTEFIKVLAECPEFKKATQYALKTDRMIDREYALRYLSFTTLDYKKLYKGNIDNFLIKGIKKADSFDEVDRERVTEQFIRVMNACHQIFGKYAFRKYNEQFHRGPINKAIFELWSVCFTELKDEQLECLERKKQAVLQKFGDLLRTEEFAAVLKSGDRSSFLKRIDMGRTFVKEFL